MKISIQINADVKDTEIAISCRQLTPEIEKLLATLRILNQQLMVVKGDETYGSCFSCVLELVWQ